jgi:hypothetical protein
MQRVKNNLRGALNNTKKGFGWTHWFPPPLLPSLKGAGTDSDHGGKTRLRQAKTLADGFYIWFRVLEHTRGLAQALADLTSLLDALT